MTTWEFIRQLDKKGFARWLAFYTLAVNGVENPAEEDYDDLIELTYRVVDMLDEEVQTTTCEHHDISRED